MGVARSTPQRLGRGLPPARAVRGRHLGTRGGRGADRARRTKVAAAMSDLDKAAIGSADVRVDIGAIEKSLNELWRGQDASGDSAVSRRAPLEGVGPHSE